MAGRLGVDFGTSNTVVALWDEEAGRAGAVAITGYGREFAHGGLRVPVVPSLIHYTEDGRRLLGDQVLDGALDAAAGTFRWMKRYIGNRSPATVRAAGRSVGHAEAGRDFLSTVLAFAALETATGTEEVALTVPVESFEYYEEWMADVALTAGVHRFRLVDEPSAAALGYGAHMRPGRVHLLFDFGGGTLQAAVVRVLADDERSGTAHPCRVLGKAGDEIGGSTIDQWIFAEVLARAGRADGDDDVREVSRALLIECERAKEALTDRERASVGVMHPRTGAVLGLDLVRSGEGSPDGRVVSFEELLDRHGLFARIDRVVRRALRASGARGYDVDDVDAVLMVGGSSLIPAVRRTLERIFGRDRVLSDRPLDAVARGAAALAAGVDFYDHIQHDYAIRWFDPASGEYRYRPCVAAGTPYPTAEPVATVTVKATYDGQRELGLALFELAAPASRPDEGDAELVLDSGGAWRLSTPTPEVREARSRFWVNERTPTFLVADPPATAGQARFRVELGIDGNKRLLLTAHDLVRGTVTHRDHPVVRLS